MPKSKPTGRRKTDLAVPLGDLSVDTNWVLNEEGEIKLLKAKTRAGKQEVPHGIILALALTQRGVAVGKGKVYFTQPHPRPEGFGTNPSFGHFDGFLLMKTVPQLFYVPESWTTARKEAWLKLTPEQQVHQLDSRHGWIDDSAVVMPIVVDHDIRKKTCRREQKTLHLPNFDGYTAAPISVHLSSHCLVAPTKELRDLCVRKFRANDSRNPERLGQPHSTWYEPANGLKWQDFQQWEVDGLDGVMEELDAVCRVQSTKFGVPAELCFETFRSLRERVWTAAADAHEFGQDYGCEGLLSDWNP